MVDKEAGAVLVSPVPKALWSHLPPDGSKASPVVPPKQTNAEALLQKSRIPGLLNQPLGTSHLLQLEESEPAN